MVSALALALWAVLTATSGPVDFVEPPREYLHLRLAGWELCVERQLADDDGELAVAAQSRLEYLLGDTKRLLPTRSQALLGSLRLFLMDGVRSRGGGRNNGLEYFQRTAPRFRRELDARMASSVVIYSAENWMWNTEARMRMALVHEFAHAWQLEQWPEDQPDIDRAYRAAMAHGLYRDVLDDQARRLPAAYATTNRLEYFAELSMIYFTGGYYQPFDRAMLRVYDPAGYAMVEKMWSSAGVAPTPALTPSRPAARRGHATAVTRSAARPTGWPRPRPR